MQACSTAHTITLFKAHICIFKYDQIYTQVFQRIICVELGMLISTEYNHAWYSTWCVCFQVILFGKLGYAALLGRVLFPEHLLFEFALCVIAQAVFLRRFVCPAGLATNFQRFGSLDQGFRVF